MSISLGDVSKVQTNFIIHPFIHAIFLLSTSVFLSNEGDSSLLVDNLFVRFKEQKSPRAYSTEPNNRQLLFHRRSICFLCWLPCQIPLHLTPKGFFYKQFSHKCFMMLSYIWTIRLCQPCHMLHMAIMAIMAQSDYMQHGNHAIIAIIAQSDYIMPHATHGCPYCVMLWSSQQGRW